MKDMDDIYRREVLGAVATGIGASIAGCSDQGGSTSTPQDTEASTSQNGGNSEQDNSTAESTQNTGQTQATSQEDPVGEDFQYNGEEPVENSGAYSNRWIELEHTSQQIEMPFETDRSLPDGAFYFGDEEFNIGNGRQNIDALYILLSEPQEENKMDLSFVALDSDDYDSSKTFTENEELGVAVQTTGHGYTPADIQTIFSEDITGYDDVSEDFPQEYLDLIES